MQTNKPLELYPFSHWDEIRGRWVKGRYVASLADIQARYPRHRIDGPPEVRADGPCGFVIKGR